MNLQIRIYFRFCNYFFLVLIVDINRLSKIIVVFFVVLTVTLILILTPSVLLKSSEVLNLKSFNLATTISGHVWDKCIGSCKSYSSLLCVKLAEQLYMLLTEPGAIHEFKTLRC